MERLVAVDSSYKEPVMQSFDIFFETIASIHEN